MGGCKTEVVMAPPVIIETAIGKIEVPPVAPKAEKSKKERVEAVRESIKELEKPLVPETKPEPVVEKPQPVTNPSNPPVGIDLTGLFKGEGASRKPDKDVFLAAVEKAKNLATLVALNATCDCGFATGDFTEETAPVLKRKLARWGAAQE
jgi:hypothetical protein